MHLEKLILHPDKYPVEDVYPFSVPALNCTGDIELGEGVTFFVGKNGTGKSTVLEAVARRCNIHIWQSEARVRYARNRYEAALHFFMSVKWCKGTVPGSFFASQIFHNFSEYLDEWASTDPGLLKYFGGDSLMAKSHGQSLMAFFESRFKLKGLYLLDEPETALAPPIQLELLKLLMEMSRDGHAQFIIATHSPILLACPEAKILSFDEAPIKQIEYEETEHYKFYKSFLNDREQYLKF